MQTDTSTSQTTGHTNVIAPDGLDSLVTLVEHVCGLPAVATLDWCDRAAAGFTSVVTGSTAIILLTVAGADGTIREVESIGVARQGGDLADLRARAERVTTLGVDLSSVRAGRTLSGSASRLLAANSPITNLIGSSDAVVGISPLGEPGAGRCVCVIVGSNATLPDWLTGVVSSILPSLSRKIGVAIGSSSTPRSSWISPREQLVLEQLILGKSVKQIADDLGRSPHTVHDHVKALHRKLNASSRGELVARALGHLIEGTRIRHHGPGEEPRRAA